MANRRQGAVEEVPTQLEFDAHDAQLTVLNSPSKYTVLDCGRRWGKDHLAPIKILTHSFSYQSPRGKKLYAYINPIYNPQSKDSFRVFCELAGSGGLIQRTIETPPMEVHLVNGDVVRFFSADRPDNLRGGQYDGVIINEAAFIANLEGMWNGPILAMLLDRDGWAQIQSTPNGKNGFYHLYLRGISDDKAFRHWTSFRFPTSTNPFISEEQLKEIQHSTPADIFAQEFLAEFLDDGGAVFRGLNKMMEQSAAMELELLPQSDNCRVGIDVARHTDFTVCLALSHDHKVIGFDRFQDLDWNTIQERILTFCARYRGRVVIDSAGAGDVLYDNLVRKGIPTTPAKFTNERKAQWVQNLAALIQEGVIHIPLPRDRVGNENILLPLWAELESYGYQMLPSGKIKYGAPVGLHDDCVTALFLAASEQPPHSIIMPGDPNFDMDLNDVRLPGEGGYL